MAANSGTTERGENWERISVKNIIWIDTIYWVIKCKFAKLPINGPIRSNLSRFQPYHEVYYLKAAKTSRSEFTVRFYRVLVNPDVRPDDGFLLNVHILLVGSRIPPKSLVMDHNDDSVSVTYDFNVIKSKKKGSWVIKCVIKMLEKTNLRNEAQEQQTEKLKDIAKHHDSAGTKTHEMLYLLRGNTFSDVFSGRQKMDFALKKLNLIDRSFKYVSELARKFESRVKKYDYTTSTPLRVYLGHILSGQPNEIGKKECASLYLDAHRHGLEFLKFECKEFMMMDVDIDSLMDLLISTDMVNDFPLMRWGLDIFLRKRHEVMNSERWKKLTEESLPVARSIVDASIRRLMSDDCHVGENEE